MTNSLNGKEKATTFHSENRATQVFVYGTLKKGFGNHHLLARSKFLGSAVTKDKYALYVSGIPFVIRDESVSQILGEVYGVDEDTLTRLDGLEGHPEWYRRELVTVSLNEYQNQTQHMNAWLYFFPEPQGKLIPRGEFI